MSEQSPPRPPDFDRAGKEDAKGGEEKEDEMEGEDDIYDMFYLPVEEDFRRGDARAMRLCKEYDRCPAVMIAIRCQ